jgi:uncharacterized protein (DUF433 family)
MSIYYRYFMFRKVMTRNEPKLGEGIYLIKDVSEILLLPYSKVRYWMHEFWDSRFGKTYGGAYSFGEQGNKAVNFFALIEFYTFYQLRIKGVSSQQIQKAHQIMSKELNTPFPFATAEVSTDKKNIWYETLGNIIKADGKMQFDFKKLISPFLHKVEFDKNNVATRFFPLENSKNVVVDPKHQFGQPTISGRNINVATIKKLYEGGESKESISILYNLKSSEVNDALRYYKRAS